MRASGTTFDAIIEEVFKQKQVLEALLEENKELRQQLADLRAGKNLYLEILGERIPLIVAEQENAPEASTAEKEDTLPTTIVTAAEQDKKAELARQETAAIPDPQASPPDSPEPEQAFVIEEVDEEDVPEPLPASSTFLEDALIDEFSMAATRQMGVWTPNGATPNPISNYPTPALDEEEKATLRRELKGSFLLE